MATKKITEEMAAMCYEIAKSYLCDSISIVDGSIKVNEKLKMNQSSAKDYIYLMSRILKGEYITRCFNQRDIIWVLEKIKEEYPQRYVDACNVVMNYLDKYDNWRYGLKSYFDKNI